MTITEINKLDFVVYTWKDMHIETIWFEQEKWNKKFLPKLNFFFDCMGKCGPDKTPYLDTFHTVVLNCNIILKWIKAVGFYLLKNFNF